MAGIDRRTLLRNILPGAVVTAVGVTAIATVGLSLVPPNAAQALPVDKLNALKTTDLVEKAQVVVVGPRRRRRRWTCWWYRGRRRCGWRWVRW
jgi:hypothetical protein